MLTQIRRRFIRWEIDQSASCNLDKSEQEQECVVKDISLKGARVALKSRLEKDRPVNLKIAFNSEFYIDVQAWAVWDKMEDGTNVYGLYFTRITDKDKDRIFEFVKQNFPQQVNKIWWDEPEQDKKDTKMEDRRIFARFPVRLPLKFFNGDTGEEGLASTIDVSAKGIGLVTDVSVSRHTLLEMSLQLQDNAEPIVTQGEVVWSSQVADNKYRIGVCLNSPDLMGFSRILRMPS